MKKLFFMVLAIVLLLSGCKPETIDEPPPDWQLPSGIAYGELEQAIDDYMEYHKDYIPAVSVSVFTRDQVLLEKAYGYADIAGGVLNDADTVFEWGSITKTMVWVSAMQLYEQGKLDLNADIRTYIPEDFFRHDFLYDEPITMLNLMNHTSGLTAISTVRFDVEYGEKVDTLEQELRLAELYQSYPPGKYQLYSNYGAALAGYVVESISGMPFYEYVHSNIFKPLGMAHTALKPDLSDNEWVNAQRDKLKCYSFMQDIGYQRFQFPLYPAGMATGAIADLRRYGQALLPDAKGSSQLFTKAATLAEMYTPTYISEVEGEDEYRHGFFKYPYMNVIGHGGTTRGCSSLLLIDIDSGVGFVTMMNQRNDTVQVDKPYPKQFPELIFGVDQLD